MLRRERFLVDHDNLAAVLFGDVREQIKAAAVEESVDLVVLGRPTDESSRLKLEALRAFAAEIEEETGISAVIPET